MNTFNKSLTSTKNPGVNTLIKAVTNTTHASVHPFPSRRLNQQAKAWEFNISQGYVFAKLGKYKLQVKSKNAVQQFDLLCKLLKAGTCKIIYIDCLLSADQTALIRILQRVSGTEIVNARFTHAFAHNERLQA